MPFRIRQIWIRAIALTVLLCLAGTVQAYQLPTYAITDADRERPTEEIVNELDQRREELAVQLAPYRLQAYEHNRRLRLSRQERKAVAPSRTLDIERTFWKTVARLKRDLIALHQSNQTAAVQAEADAIAKIIIETIYALSQEYRVAVSALVHNVLINTGFRKKGFCYHYVDDLREALGTKDWKQFDIHWGEAWPKDFRENNALIITAEGKPFETGIAVDSWRTAGKPFWTPVKGDRFPWKEFFGNVERPDQ